MVYELDSDKRIIKKDMQVINRVTSGNLSVGIGLMMESIFSMENRVDEKRDIPQKVDLKNYNVHAFNSLTMLREAVTSMASNVYKPDSSETIKNMSMAEYILNYKKKEVMNIVKDDMNLITNMYNNTGVTPILYFPTYVEIYNKINKGKDIKPTKKMDEINLYMEISKTLLDNKAGLLCGTMKLSKPIEEKINILVTTSYLLDLHLLKGDLLETHTGKLKNKHKLNSKFKSIPKVDLSNIPFNFTTHKIFGDNTLVSPLPMSIRKEIIELSLKKKWNTHTSEELIKEQTKSILK